MALVMPIDSTADCPLCKTSCRHLVQDRSVYIRALWPLAGEQLEIGLLVCWAYWHLLGSWADVIFGRLKRRLG